MLKKLYFCEDFNIENGVLTIEQPIITIDCSKMSDHGMLSLVRLVSMGGFGQFINGVEVTCCYVLPKLDNSINTVKFLKETKTVYFQPILSDVEWNENRWFNSFDVYDSYHKAKADFPNSEIGAYSGNDIEDSNFIEPSRPEIGKYTWDYIGKWNDGNSVLIRLTNHRDLNEDSYVKVETIFAQLKEEGHAVTDIFIQNSILIEGGVTSL